MAIRKVARMGHPVLRKKARELTNGEIKSPQIQQLIQDMIETMNDYSGIGIAAPQVYESVRLSLIDLAGATDRYPDVKGDLPQGLGVYINPKITVLDETEQGFWEGCLSVPELRGLVHRPRKIRVEYTDHHAKTKTLEAEGFLATVFQHEFDHLDGVLFVDRIKDMKNLAFVEEYQRFHAPLEDDEVGELAD